MFLRKERILQILERKHHLALLGELDLEETMD
jgi:hypothetical protein